MRSILHTVSEYRWPIYLGSLLFMCVCACATIVFVATRPDAPRPIKGYYEAARTWDAGAAIEESSRQLGWSVRYDFPADVPHFAGTPRPIDVTVADRDGRPVSGLAGQLIAVRPADSRFNQTAPIVEIPQQRGSYRTLLLLDSPGTWELRIDATQQALRFVQATRVSVPADADAGAEGASR